MRGKRKRWLILLLAVLIAAAGALLLHRGRPRFDPDAQLTITRQEDGWQLAWPQVQGAERYQVQAESQGQTLLEQTVDQPGCTLPAVQDGRVRIRIRPLSARGRGAARTWQVEDAGAIPWPSLTGFEARANDDACAIDFAWQGEGADRYLLYRLGEDGTVMERPMPTYTMYLGQEGQMPLPAYGQQIRFAGSLGRLQGDILFCCPVSAPHTFVREDFLGTEIHLNAVQQEDNCYTFRWNEAKGSGYILQYQTGQTRQWTDLARVQPAEQPSCQVKLRSGTDYSLRVVAEGAASRSEPIRLTTGLSTLYATVWPIQDLEVYADTGRQQVMGTLPAVCACCVLEETEGLFRVRTPEGEGYIDADLCLINLPDYIGELCLYDITNSYDSRYMVHGYGIPEITGTVIVGYENVCLAQGEYLAPLLYPSAQKLAQAARAALEDGYRLKIYDAYRPRQATLELYRITGEHLQDPIPEQTYTGQPVDDLPEGIPLLHELLAGQEADPAGADSAAPAPSDATNGWLLDWAVGGETSAGSEAASSEATASSEAVPPPVPEETVPQPDVPAETPPQPEGYLTYYQLMTGGRYHLGSFLARNGSTHNLGIAMDLTLVDVDTGEELQMQTAMHDLSCYAVLARNNQAAELLADYMMGAGFAPLTSEWWHFQDDDTRDALGLEVYQEKGVSLEGWHRDLEGWYYCGSDGSRLSGPAADTDGGN